jgi:Lysophospholipase
MEIKAKNRLTSWVKFITIALLVFSVASMVLMALLFRLYFGRSELKPDEIALNYNDINPIKYPRKTIKFDSNGNFLRGYIYGEDNRNGLIIYAHGIYSGADSFLAETLYFVDNGWCVFAFDGTGSRESEGKGIGGLPQGKVDVEAALDYISNDDILSKLPVILYGHSMGGYGVASALNNRADEVSAVICNAAFNSPMDTMYYQIKNVAKFIAVVEYPFIWLYQRSVYGKDFDITAVDGINASNTPILIIYSESDTTIPYDEIGIYAYRDSITNQSVVFKSLDTQYDGHTTVLLSEESGKYSTEQWEALYELRDSYGSDIPEVILSEFIDSIDKSKMSELNLTRMEFINNFMIDAITIVE